jgi:hypothetical protein
MLKRSWIPRPLRGAKRNSIRVLMTVIGLIIIDLQPIPFLVGSLLILAGSGLRLWSKGYLQQNKVLTTGGPYRWTRNPFYLGNALLDLGICFIVNRVDFFLIYLLLWLYIHYRTILSEEKRLNDLFGENYLLYKSQVPRLIPLPWKRLSSPTCQQQRFSWNNPNISHDLEIPRFLRTLTLPLLFFCTEEIRYEGALFLYDYYGMEFFALCALLFLYTASYFIKKPLKLRKASLPAWAKSRAVSVVAFAFYMAFLFFNFKLETEIDLLVYPVGFAVTVTLIIFFLYFFLFSRSNGSAIHFTLAQWVIFFLAAVMAELPWAGFIASVYYSCLLADQLFIDQAGTVPVFTNIPWRSVRKYYAFSSCLFLVLTSTLMVLKEYISDDGSPIF